MMISNKITDRLVVPRSLLLSAALMVSAGLAQVSSAQEIVSGLAVGAPTQSVPVLDVTGAYKGQRICYVCEFQDDPNILAFFKDTSDATKQFILQLNELYAQNKSGNFKVVATIVAGPDASSWLEQLSETEKLEIPLVVFRRGPADVATRLFEINPEIHNTFLLTQNRFVVANVAGISPDEFALVADATASMLASDGL